MMKDRSGTFMERLQARVAAADSLLCVGLDPHPGLLSEQEGAAARAFCERIIEGTESIACAFKINAAFFERLGASGWRALQVVIEGIPAEIPVILDAKRGDIASTAEAYASSAFDQLDADAITLSPYLGQDSLAPFLERADRAVFLLCKTSNAGSSDLQTKLLQSGEPLYVAVAREAAQWGSPENLAFVVGATDPLALRNVRRAAPEHWILAPGVGAQGGDLEGALRAGLRADGAGLILPVSRAIAGAPDPAAEAERLRVSINKVRRSPRLGGSLTGALDGERMRLADELLAAGCVRFGEFELKSGQISPIYFDLRPLVSSPALLQEVAAAYRPILQRLPHDRLAALPYGGLPIGTAVSLLTGTPLIYPRKEAKSYGTSAQVEGDYRPGEQAVILDDLVTTGGTKFEAIGQLEGVGLEVRDIVVLIDREGGAREDLATAGYRLHAVLDVSKMVDHWAETDRVPPARIEEVRRFLAAASPESEK